MSSAVEPDRLVPLSSRVTLTVGEAAAALGVSREFFKDHIRDELRLIHRGRLVLVPVSELQRWADASAARVIE